MVPLFIYLPHIRCLYIIHIYIYCTCVLFYLLYCLRDQHIHHNVKAQTNTKVLTPKKGPWNSQTGTKSALVPLLSSWKSSCGVAVHFLSFTAAVSQIWGGFKDITYWTPCQQCVLFRTVLSTHRFSHSQAGFGLKTSFIPLSYPAAEKICG